MLQNILICLGVAAAVAFAAGILLAVSSYFFAVKEDEKTCHCHTTLSIRHEIGIEQEFIHFGTPNFITPI